MKIQIYHLKLLFTICGILGASHLMAQTSVALDWHTGFGGRYTDEGNGMVADQWGNIYTVGSIFNDTVGFNVKGQWVTLSPSGAEDIIITKQDANGNFLWVKNIGGSGSDVAQSIALDGKDGVYFTGYFSEIINFNPGTTSDQYESVRGTRNRYTSDFFVCKLDTAGTFQWVRVGGSSIGDLGRSIVYDAVDDAILVTGEFGGDIDFGFGSAPSSVLSSNGDADIFVAKLSRNGDLIWAANLGGVGPEFAGGISVDTQGNVFTTGNFFDPGDYDPAPGTTHTLTSRGSSDVFISKLDKSGNFIWAKSIGGKMGETVRGIAVADDGSIHLTGSFSDTVNFDPNKEHLLRAAGGAADIFILKLSKDGDFRWVKGIGATADDIGEGIVIGHDNNVYVTGWFQGRRADFDPGTNPQDTFYLDAVKGNLDAFLLKLDSAGQFKWAFNMGPQGRAHALAYHDYNIYVTGRYHDTTYFDPSLDKSQYRLTSTSPSDGNIFVVKYLDCSGNIPFISDHGAVCSNQDYIYRVSGTVGADNFMWEIPNSWTGSSNTDDISVHTGDAGIIRVTVFGLCDTAYAELQVTTHVIQVDITAAGNILNATNGFASYQWLKGDTLIPGANSSQYTVLENGTYAVIVTNDEGCIDTSAHFEINNLGIAGIHNSGTVLIYPNPVKDKLYIHSDQLLSALLTSIDGKTIGQFQVLDHYIKLNDLAPGVFFIHLFDEQNQLVERRKILKH